MGVEVIAGGRLAAVDETTTTDGSYLLRSDRKDNYFCIGSLTRSRLSMLSLLGVMHSTR